MTRQRWFWPTVVVATALVAGGLYWFQPHKLFLDERASEALPPSVTSTTEAATSPLAGEGEAPRGPRDLALGQFVSLDHDTTGVVRVLDVGDGSRILRMEGLDTSNGPDLYLYLSTNPPDGPEAAFDDDFYNVGRLKANQGDQNYDLPAELDLERFASVVIWCDRFDSAFGAADLRTV